MTVAAEDYIAYPIKIMVHGFMLRPKYLVLEEDRVSYKDRSYKYEQITNLYYSYRQSVTNFVPNTTVWLGLKTLDGEKIFALENGLKKRIANVRNAYTILQERSIDSRAHSYISQLAGRGYFDYTYGPESLLEKAGNFAMWSKSHSGTMRIHNDGFIEYGSKRLNLRVAKDSGVLEFGYRRGAPLHEERTTFGILISEKGSGFFDSKFAFEAFWDTEVIRYIISELASGNKF
jgi:hypothetical protein